MGLSGEASALPDQLVRLRRELHREPELGLDLPRTQERVLAWLEGLPLGAAGLLGIMSAVDRRDPVIRQLRKLIKSRPR